MPSAITKNIIVGVDFGTTFSGLAWAETPHRARPTDPERISTLTAWPTGDGLGLGRGITSAKVPTRLRYEGSQTQWGFNIPLDAPQHEILEWFKLYVSLLQVSVFYFIIIIFYIHRLIHHTT